MSADPLLDLDALLAPIPGDDPSGSSVPYATREQLEEGRKEVNPDDYSADDPRRPDQPKRADWPGIARLARETLMATSKDLMVAARLVEAATQAGGFVGLRDGLNLLRRMVDEGWDRIRPPVEDPSDLEVRAAPFFWLDDPDRGALFPNTVRSRPILASGPAPYSWQDWRRGQDGRGSVSLEAFEKAILATPREAIQTTHDTLVEALEALDALTPILATRLGPEAPGLLSLRKAVVECRDLAGQILARKGSAPAEAASAPATAADAPGSPSEGSTAPAAAPGRPATRDQIYRQIAEAAELLQGIEPHSPIPYLLRRAVELGSMPFPALMRELVRNPDVLGEMGRELGIKPEAAPEASESG
ncbi:type VI secretion system protein TssA [Tundrisphaera sp. TA3]|uniref:type VI secretion system protein TssA n=1 Tax=Tundrisphaera sp. TA3 TaxID=3435775 RepID=UPI003EBA4386